MRKTYKTGNNPYFPNIEEFEQMAISIDYNPSHPYSKKDVEEALYSIEHTYYNYGANMEIAAVKNLLAVHSDLERLYNGMI